jgi:catechol 2,3-dioxygenase-like lactoylglutathione lyase family enzyme
MLSESPVFPILLSTDLDASRQFFHGVLGLPILREDPPDRVIFGAGGGTQLVVTLSTVGTKDTQTQMAWRVPDIRAAVADLRERGVRIEEYDAPDPVTRDGVADMGHSWAAWVLDPSGNVLAVVEPKP